ncbi:MAG: hypothetical protein KC910_26580, partial [Candidatus Eremiobacteraeota bacterium]|nr:hypothetical protein [Candidatus Eremiobacteraeota bacterium]
MDRRRFLSLLPIAALASLPAWSQALSGDLRGTLAGKNIAMTLEVAGQTVTGQYTYLRAGVTLTLQGTLAGEACTLQEFY